MAQYLPIPAERKLTRRKTGVDPYYKTPTYGLYTYDHVLVAEVSNTSVGAEDYPWSWVLADGIASNHPRGTMQGTTQTLAEAVDVISHLYRIKGVPVRTEGRSKIGIEWYATEEEALARSVPAIAEGVRKMQLGYDFGYMSIGRDTAYDYKNDAGVTVEFAVVTP